MSTETDSISIDRDIGNFFYDVTSTRDAGVGLTEKTIDYIVDVKGEPEWLREFRKNAYNIFKSKPLPTHWAGDELKEIDFDVIRYYLASGGAAHVARYRQRMKPRRVLRVETNIGIFGRGLAGGAVPHDGGGLQRERYPERGAIELNAPGKDFESEQWYV